METNNITWEDFIIHFDERFLFLDNCEKEITMNLFFSELKDHIQKRIVGKKHGILTSITKTCPSQIGDILCKLYKSNFLIGDKVFYYNENCSDTIVICKK